MLTQFNHYLPVNLIFGAGKTEELGKETAKYGRKAMIVTGQNSTKRTGLLDRAKALLEKEGLEVVIFDKAEPNPLASIAMKGAAVAKEEGCDVIVGLGGGSIMDCSKAVAFAACNEGNIFDYIYGIKKGEKAIKIFSPAPFIVKEDEDGEEKEVVKRMFYKPCSVFDISQTEGKDLPSQFCPQEIAGNVDYFSEILNAAEMVCPCRIVYEDLRGMNGYYHKDSDHISVRNDMSELMTIKTLIHEIAHQKLHSDGAEEECATREKKEVQAESIAFIVAERFGIDTSAYSFNYIAAWSKDRKQDELEESLKVIKKTADWFITEMENVLSDEVKNENQ